MSRTIRATVAVRYVDAQGQNRRVQKECRFSVSTPQRVIKAWKRAMRAKLERRIPAAAAAKTGTAGTLSADAQRYLPLVRHLADWTTRRSEIRAWIPHLGHLHRHAIDRTDILRVRGVWKTEGLAHRTINNRVSALKDLYRKLDGDDAPNPCSAVRMLPPPRTPIQRVSPETVNAVLDKLLELGLMPPRRGRPVCHALQDRGRLMVLASTGRRPCEVERAQRRDVDLVSRVWGVRDAKGGWSEGLYLNDEMVIAWQTFAAVDAWGPFPAHFARRLRCAGWPEGVKPYQVRHATWIAASERGADLPDISAGAGHRNLKTTREHYVPVLRSRMQKLSELIDGRFGWRPDTADQPND